MSDKTFHISTAAFQTQLNLNVESVIRMVAHWGGGGGGAYRAETDTLT